MGSAKSSRLLTLEKGFKVLELIVERKLVTVTEVAKVFAINKSSAHRFLSTLKVIGYVEKNAQSGYSLTGRLDSLARGLVPKLEVRQLVRPYLEELLNIFQQTTNLGHWEGNEVSYLDQLAPKEILNSDLHVGARIPAYCTAMGKAILAFLPGEELDEYLVRVTLEAHTEKTITDPVALREELQTIRELGYAVMEEELVIGLRGVAAPIFDKRKYPQYSISVGAWSYRMSDETLNKAKTEVKRLADEISGFLLLYKLIDD